MPYSGDDLQTKERHPSPEDSIELCLSMKTGATMLLGVLEPLLGHAFGRRGSQRVSSCDCNRDRVKREAIRQDGAWCVWDDDSLRTSTIS